MRNESFGLLFELSPLLISVLMALNQIVRNLEETGRIGRFKREKECHSHTLTTISGFEIRDSP